ncbi:MAG: ribokinase [Terrimesophilobacter sp.]
MAIAVAGGYGIGMTMRVASAPAAGETVTGAVLAIGHGGKGSNQAVAAARLGASVALFTAVGQDESGRTARQLWAAEGVDATAVIELPGATMTGFIIVDGSGENRITIAPGVLEDIQRDDAELFRSKVRAADVLLVSLEIPLEVAAALLRIAREEGTTTVLNPAPAANISIDVWSLVDVVTPNYSEAMTILGSGSIGVSVAEVARRLQRKTLSTVVLTNGHHGVIVDDGKDHFVVDAVTAQMVRDTTGAGDAFSAAFVVAMAEGRPLRDAVEFAAAAGAFTVSTDGVIPALATRIELEDFMRTTNDKRRGIQ